MVFSGNQRTQRRLPARPSTANQRTRGLVLGVVAVVGYLVVAASVGTTLGGSSFGAAVVSGLFSVAPCWWVLAIALVAADPGVRSRGAVALVAGVAVAITVVDVLMMAAAVVGGFDSAVTALYLSRPWFYTYFFVVATAVIGAWILGRRANPVALVAAPVGGLLAVVATVVAYEVVGYDWDVTLWTRRLVLSTIPMAVIGVGCCWLAVAIDKTAAGGGGRSGPPDRGQSRSNRKKYGAGDPRRSMAPKRASSFSLRK